MPLPAKNLLADEASPYLRQHRDNPVHWRPWSAASLAEAAELDRPILLSIGYAACHWCHVMAHESFEDHATAEVMNRLFTNIKVDREERPDIDQIYMAALNATGEQGGWPLTMFLAPDGRPFWGGTYFPKTARYGRPGFVDVLRSVHHAWREKRSDIERSASGLRDFVSARLAGTSSAISLGEEALSQLADGVGKLVDPRLGGIRGAPKFPNAPLMTTLWLSWLRDGRSDHRDAVIHSLRSMLNGGIFDHVGGGLCRYSTDDRWLVPHFEKMLYDNAQLLRMASWACAEAGDRLFRSRIEATGDWLLREMHTPEGGFASSLDADSDGVEGLFYTWTEEEVRTVLGGDHLRFAEHYRLEAPSGWEGKPILHARPEASPPDDFSRRLLESLRKAREDRARPARDDKVLAEWNGLAVVGLVEAGRLLGRRDWIGAAAAAYRFVAESDDGQGRLPRSILGGSKLYPAMSGDLAGMISAAIALRGATGEGSYLSDAARWIEQLDRWYGDGTGQGYFLTASDSPDVPMRIRGDIDEAIPSSTGQVVEALFRFALATGSASDHNHALRVAETAAARALGQPYGQAGIVNAVSLGLMSTKLVTIDRPGERVLAAIADHSPDPRRVDIALTLEDRREPLPGSIVTDPNRPSAYLCTATSCLPPFQDPEALAQALRSTAS